MSILHRKLNVNAAMEIMRLRGVGVYLHWSVPVACVILLAADLKTFDMTLTTILCWLTVLLAHECGHLLAARWKKCYVYGITLYPILGITRVETPRSRFDHAVIAWGGVIAQAALAVPFILWDYALGASRFALVNRVLLIFGYYSLLVAAFNLLPIPLLDGATAWRLIPEGFQRLRAWWKRRKGPPLPKYRSLR